MWFGTGKDASITYNGTNLVVNPKAVGSGMLDVAGTIQSDGYKSSDGSAGITDTTSYWMCNDSSCNTTCQVQIKNGLITGCT